MAVSARNRTADAMCSQEQIKSNLDQAAKENKSADEMSITSMELFDTCSNNFLSTHEINPDIKRAVDSWLGFDLSKANVDQILEGYQIALFNEKPAPGDKNKNLVRECEQINKSYDVFKQTMDLLSEHISTADLPALAQTEENKSLLSFALYSQFCASLYNLNE